jgi:hypothetical protein
MKITAETVVQIVSFIRHANGKNGKDVFAFVG